MKAILLVITSLLLTTRSYTQEFQESLDWLNSKKLESFGFFSYQVEENNSNSLKFNTDNISLNHNSNDAYTRISWPIINDIRINDDEPGKHTIWIVSNYMFEGLPLYIGMKFSTKDLRDRFAKAISHVVQLKSGNLINEQNYTISKNSAVNILRARLIDVFEGGEKKLRLDITEDKIKKYYLKSTESTEIYWKNVKEIKSSLYDANKNYWKITIIGSPDTAGNIPEITFYIYKAVAKNFNDALHSLALQNGANLVKEDLF